MCSCQSASFIHIFNNDFYANKNFISIKKPSQTYRQFYASSRHVMMREIFVKETPIIINLPCYIKTSELKKTDNHTKSLQK